MSALKMWALIAEIVFCFLPISIYLLLGIPMSALQIFFLSSGISDVPDEAVLASVLVILSTLVGLLGLFALLNVVIKIFDPHARAINHKVSLVFASLAVLLLLIFTFFADPGFWKLVFFLPLVSAAHIAYLGRAYLFDFRLAASIDNP